MILHLLLLIAGPIVCLSGENADGVSSGDGPVTGAVGSGHTGNRAVVEVVFQDSDVNGEYTTRTYQLSGTFSPAGARVTADGEIKQVGSFDILIIGDIF